MISRWEDTGPIGDNPPVDPSGVVFQLWADVGVRVHTSLVGSYQALPIGIPDAYSFHEYSVRYEGGAYSFLIDGQSVFGPVTSALRPTAIWVGNPVFTDAGSSWAAFTFDHITVEADSPTAVTSWSWGKVKIRYR
jgi:hypothetical protein